MGRTKEQSREYMRTYRARKRAGDVVDVVNDLDRQGAGRGRNWAGTRIAELETTIALQQGVIELQERAANTLLEEVRHLKEELAKRPPIVVDAQGRDVTRSIGTFSGFGHSRPAPKPGHG